MQVPSAFVETTDEDVAAVVEVLRSGVLANGPQALQFENEFAAEMGARHAVAVSSGTDALYVAGRALGVAAGDVVLVSGFSFGATANAFIALGATVVPVDVNRATFNMSAEALARTIQAHPRAKLVCIVDLFGSTHGTDEALEVARSAGIPVVEDACQAHGALGRNGERVGARSALTAFSLYATKNLAAGEGGVITTDNDWLARQARLLRNHGSSSQYVPEISGLNHRLPEMSAALARSRLRRLRTSNDRRRQIAIELSQLCQSVIPEGTVPQALPYECHVFHQFTVVLPDPKVREQVRNLLRDRGVDARVFYPYTIGQLPGVVPVALPTAAWLRDRVLSLPVHPGLSNAQLDHLHIAMVAAGQAVSGRG